MSTKKAKKKATKVKTKKVTKTKKKSTAWRGFANVKFRDRVSRFIDGRLPWRQCIEISRLIESRKGIKVSASSVLRASIDFATRKGIGPKVTKTTTTVVPTKTTTTKNKVVGSVEALVDKVNTLTTENQTLRKRNKDLELRNKKIDRIKVVVAKV